MVSTRTVASHDSNHSILNRSYIGLPDNVQGIALSLSRDYQIIMTRRFYRSSQSQGSYARRVVHGFLLALERQFLDHYFGGPPEWRVRLRNMSPDRTPPDFSVIGPFKAGTSDLATSLLLHPCVMTPLSKEIASTDLNRITAYYPTAKEKLLRKRQYGAALSPYLTPALHWIDCAYKLSRINRAMKVVITLRNPISRLYSHWKWEMLLANNGILSDLSFMLNFDDYIEKSLELYPHTPMFTACRSEGLRTSVYWQSVRCWVDMFGMSNVLVVESDEYFRRPSDVLNEIFDFVGLPRIEFPAKLHDTVNENPLKFPPPSEMSIAKLQQFFRPHNEKLWQIIGKRFDW